MYECVVRVEPDRKSRFVKIGAPFSHGDKNEKRIYRTVFQFRPKNSHGAKVLYIVCATGFQVGIRIWIGGFGYWDGELLYSFSISF